MKLSMDARFFGTWAVLFVAGVLLLLYAPGAWPALGWIIVAPTVITILLLSWFSLVYKLVKAWGGDPTAGSVGIWAVLSGVTVLFLLVAIFSHHRA